MSIAIEVEDLAKKFRINHAAFNGHLGKRTLRESVAGIFRNTWANLRSGAALGHSEDFWALQDINFKVQEGEVVGIIGRNGAGKSTLLKILTRISEPTRGTATIRGRVGSLLEVGTGFHPELTGRENVFLNGSILGMRRSEIRRKFDEIVDFSGVEQFIDTPVKRYSSGMKVRLAFSVAAHLDLEVLLVDEVLAVGDADFQRKCLQRLRDVTHGGKTVLFVSHNMPAVESLCDRVLLLSKGEVEVIGDVDSVIRHYYQMNPAQESSENRLQYVANSNDERNILRRASIVDNAGAPTDHILVGRELRLRMTYYSALRLRNPIFCIAINDTLSQRVMTLFSPLSSVCVDGLEGHMLVECRIPDCPLAPGEYTLTLGLRAAGTDVESIEQAITFRVENAELFGEGRGFHRGICVARAQWHTTLKKEDVGELSSLP
ncbi:MAG: ABC transporter ATP-binding protein [Planctomycetota bacterium]|nr:ABC transporter ATP-binding protein [Planctomycetota bacterium]